MHRRAVLRALAIFTFGSMLPRPLLRETLAGFPAISGPGPYGPLLGPDALGLMLPAGFTAREVARAGELVPGTAHVWHAFPDGGAVFRARRGGWIYVSNSEQFAPNGGVGALHFDRGGTIVDAYTICTGTSRNCAGGATPWRTWLTCEEVATGLVWECDPTGASVPVARTALGTFQHEAVTIDRRRTPLSHRGPTRRPPLSLHTEPASASRERDPGGGGRERRRGDVARGAEPQSR